MPIGSNTENNPKFLGNISLKTLNISHKEWATIQSVYLSAYVQNYNEQTHLPRL